MLAHDIFKKDKDRKLTNSKSSSYFGLLILAKILKCIGIFFIDILERSIHCISLLWLIKITASVILVPLQKPLSSGKSLSKLRGSIHARIGQLALINCLIEIFWFYGITFCGPLRSILVFDHSSTVILVALTSFIKGTETTSKTRGVFCLIIGFIALFFMDPDTTTESNHIESHGHHRGLNYLFYKFLSMFGLADHKGGLFLLIIASLLKIYHDSSFRLLAVEIGGPKRLYTINTFITGLFLTPLAVLAFATSSSVVDGYFSFFTLLILATLFTFILDFYIESLCFQHVPDPVNASARWSPITMFLCSLILAYVWYQPFESMVGMHMISGGVVVTVFLFCCASYLLTNQYTQKSHGGYFIGLSPSGAPLFTTGEAFLQKTSRSAWLFIQDTLKDILSNADSRRIFYFLCVNLAFCGVEFIYGYLTNSLGLISDAFHMLFDCSALIMGLVASVLSRWPASKGYPYGYGRIEILSGFINAMFLVVIAISIFFEAIGRIMDPPDIKTDKLLFVAVAGLCVNLFGMYAFHGDHGHSHGGGGSHGHSHGGNANMKGVFLHVLADTLGSVFVIISTILIQIFGWTFVDPLCSLVLSMLILGSVYPLLKDATVTLMQGVSDEEVFEYEGCLEKILTIEGVLSFSRVNFWQLKSGNNVISIHVQVKDEVNEQAVRFAIEKILNDEGIKECSIQIEKSSFSKRIQTTCPNYELVPPTKKGQFLRTVDHIDDHGHSHDDGHGHSHDSGHGHSHNTGHGHSHESDRSHSHNSMNKNSHDSGHLHSHTSGHGHSHNSGNGHSHNSGHEQSNTSEQRHFHDPKHSHGY
uniref:Proton-coupled zinc antiporter SLC30A5 n=1 Tax=Strongyloides stercoralis TaxID=6248 RepID=A0A0K0DS87_STRER